MGIEEYIRAVREFVPTLKEVDPSIKIVVCGAGDIHKEALEYQQKLLDGCAELIDYASVHHYEEPHRAADGLVRFEHFIHEAEKQIAASANPNIKLYVSEWNCQTIDWRTGLYAAELLNIFERCGDVVEMSGPALFIRHTTYIGWINGFINHDHRTWFPAPNYVVMKSWREHYAPFLVEAVADTAELNYVATKSQDGQKLYFKVVNPDDKEATVELNIKKSFAVGKTTMQIIAPDSLYAYNSLDKPHTVGPEKGKIEYDGQKIGFTMPRWSAGVVTIERK